MAINSITNYNYYFPFNRKRCFLTLLLCNALAAFVYYVHIQTQLPIKERFLVKERENYNKTAKQLIDTSIANNFIKRTLENEYDYDDLIKFYNITATEFSLGLRCIRNSQQPQATTTISSNTTTNSLLSKTTIKTTTLRVVPRRYHRRKLYTYTISNSDSCSNETVDLLVIIISKSDNYKTRDAIRRTWGSGKNLGIYSSINVKIFFLIDFDEKLTSNIRLENELFHDIIQVALPPQYTLVTYRVLSLFEWSFRFCRSAKFLFKTDDDIFINLILLLKFISSLIDQKVDSSFRISDMTLYGYKHQRPGVFRQASDAVGARYVITPDEFPCSHYPDFLSGFGYLIPKKARDALVYASYQDPDRPFRISDVYLTGILPDYLSLERKPLSNYNIRYQGSCEQFFEASDSFACAAGLHHGDSSDVFEKFNRYWQCVKKFL